MTTFIQTLGAVGLASAVTRHSVESLKNDGRPEREPVLMSALALLGIVLAALLGVLAAVWNPLLSRIAVSWEGNALPLLLAGIVTATAFEFLISAYQVRLNLLRQASLRLIVSVLRAAVIVSLLAAGVRSPLVIYAGFFAPAAAGAVAAGMEFIALSPAGERPRFATMLRLAAYGGWQTLSAATVILLQHAGALVLGPVAGEEQVGLYGLGMTFSFVYGVIGSSLGSYYVPIAARLRSDDDVRTFLRRTNRINIPIILLALASLVVAVPVFQHIFGPAKQEAVPVFLLLSLAAIIGIGTVASHSLFHYFLQPRSITLAQGAGIAAFLLCALALIRYGAVGMAAAYLGSRVALWLTLRLLIRNEFRKRGIAP
jgi:O-antigen/teichoic acid export membrane protein